MKGFRRSRLVKVLAGLALLFILPALASLAWWQSVDRPVSWHAADWSSSGMLPAASDVPQAVIHVMAARTGGLKGALSVHSWIVLKRAGAASYERYDKVGWGSPVRHNAYAADARWYSNRPFIVKTVEGREAGRLIPQVEAAIAVYPHAARGGYRIWPGPNSNSFVAHVLREVPGLDAVLPPTAVGRDYLGPGRYWDFDADRRELRLSAGGYAGLAAGLASGLELNLLGLVAGIDIARPALKIPGFGRLDLAPPALAGG